MKFLKMKKSIALLAAAAVVAIAAIGAYAYWTTGGTGSGSATAGNVVGITVNQTSVTAANLYPGGPTEALSGDFTNTNPGSVVISSVSAAVTGVNNGAVDGGKPACVVGDFYITGSPTVTLGSTTIASAVNTGSWSGLAIGLANRNGTATPPAQLSPAANQDNCKGAQAVITYTVNP